MNRIIYTRPDGGLSVVIPQRDTHPVTEDISDEDCLKRTWKDVPADAINPRVVSVDDIPADRTYRNAWKCDGVAVAHDMDKAREIHRDRLRAERAPKLADLDIAYQRADEAGDAAAKKVVAAKKKALRDITKHPAIAAANTVGDLEKVTIPA